MLQKLVKVKELPPSNSPTCLPCEKCIDQYKVLGSRPSLFLPELTSHTAYLMSNWAAALAVRQGEKYSWGKCQGALSLAVWYSCRSASQLHEHTHFFSHSLLPSPSLHRLRSPRVAAAVVLVKRPVFRSHIVTVECEFWAKARVGERGGTADTEPELDPSPDMC